MRGHVGAGIAVDHEIRNHLRELFRHGAVAESPAGHRVGLRESVEDDRAFRHARHGRDRDVLPFEEDFGVDFIGHHGQIVLDGEFGDLRDFLAIQHAAGRVARTVDDQELGARRDQRFQTIDIEGEVVLFEDRGRYGRGAGEIDHRFVNGKAGVGIDRFVARFKQRQNDEEHDRLAARRHHDVVEIVVGAARRVEIVGDSGTEIWLAGGRAVVRPAVAQRIDSRFDHVRRSIEIRLADFEVDHIPALGFERPGANKHFEGGFGSEAAHARRKFHSW